MGWCGIIQATYKATIVYEFDDLTLIARDQRDAESLAADMGRDAILCGAANDSGALLDLEEMDIQVIEQMDT